MSTDLKSETTMPESDNPTIHTETPDTATPTEDSNQQIQKIWESVSGVLASLPDYVTNFFKEKPLIAVGLVVASFVSVKLLLAVLNAVNEVPLLAPTFELIGIIYTVWFVYRFLWKDVNRQELGENITAFKDQVLGKRG
ncbi:MAG: CAAD domain-containing protein [Cyanobacteria bacterium P01_H01_bin.58]